MAASLLPALGIVGMEPIEPILLASLVGEEPLLLVGPHGTGKSYLLDRLAQALGLSRRHYNASLLNFDDLVGYPLPDANGGLRYVQTPSSIWGAQTVFLDEISRCRPDVQNKLFPIIHERRVQGLLLESLVHRWSAMNPPARDDDPDGGYRGSEALDVALADRFAFIVEMPAWDEFTGPQQEQVILCADGPVDPEAGRALRARLASASGLVPHVRREMSAGLAGYVRLMMSLLRQADIVLSPRRAGMLLRNIVHVHAVRLADSMDADAGLSALLAVTHSLPQRALECGPPDRVKLQAAHRQAWQAARLDTSDPRRFLLLEVDPLRRAMRAFRVPSLTPAEFSGIVADTLAALPHGGRHAFALALFENGQASRLVAAVADQCAGISKLAAAPQELKETTAADGVRHKVWKRIVGLLGKLSGKRRETRMLTNLLVGMFAQGEIAAEQDVEAVVAEWNRTRERMREECP